MWRLEELGGGLALVTPNCSGGTVYRQVPKGTRIDIHWDPLTGVRKFDLSFGGKTYTGTTDITEWPKKEQQEESVNKDRILSGSGGVLVLRGRYSYLPEIPVPTGTKIKLTHRGGIWESEFSLNLEGVKYQGDTDVTERNIDRSVYPKPGVGDAPKESGLSKYRHSDIEGWVAQNAMIDLVNKLVAEVNSLRGRMDQVEGELAQTGDQILDLQGAKT